jgi:hypothetical protein
MKYSYHQKNASGLGRAKDLSAPRYKPTQPQRYATISSIDGGKIIGDNL